MGIVLKNEIRCLLDARNFAHIATISSDGSPLSTPVWVRREGDRVIICADESSLKARNRRRDPRVAISLVALDDPYTQAQLRGRVVEWRSDPNFQYLDAMSRKYVGKDYPFHEEAAIVLVVEIEKARYRKEPFEHTARASA